MVTLKKLSVLALCFCFASLVACGGGEEENNASTTPQMTTPQTMDMASNNNTSNTEDMGTSGDMNTSPNNTSTPEDMSGGVDMAMTTPTGDMAGGEDMAADMATPTDMGGGDMMMAGEFATMSGVVTRSVEPKNGGVGDLYVAVFDGNPMTGQGELVATAIIEDADMNPADVSIPYQVTMIPVRAEPYYYTAFLDDNDTVDQSDPDNAGPDKDDLIHVSGFSVPQTSFSEARNYEIDLDLNLAIPF